MIEIVNFKEEHLKYILETGMLDKKLQPFILPEYGKALEKAPGVFTILDDRKAIVFGGIKEFWQNRGEAWLIFGKPRTENFIEIFNIVKKFLASAPQKRIEMVVECDFVQGHRWARLLGFEKEADCLKSYLPGGYDASLYAMVRE